MSQPRRLRTRSPSSVKTMAQKPSHFSSKDQSGPVGSGPGRESIGAGRRTTRSYCFSETTSATSGTAHAA